MREISSTGVLFKRILIERGVSSPRCSLCTRGTISMKTTPPCAFRTSIRLNACRLVRDARMLGEKAPDTRSEERRCAESLSTWIRVF